MSSNPPGISNSDDNYEEGSNLYVAPASGKEAAAHVIDSIANPITKVEVERFFDRDFLELARDPDSEQYYAWGAKPGPRNIPLWQSMKRGDWVLFYQSKTYSYAAQVLQPADNEAFGEALWGRNEAGQAWRYVYFLSTPTRVDEPLERLSDFLQNSAYQGFIKIPQAKKQAILDEYGSITEFVTTRLINAAEVSTKYFLLRRNADSDWDDGDETYHYGSTVPNWTKLSVGSRVIFDQKTNNGPVVTGHGDIVSIDELSPDLDARQFYAKIGNYRNVIPQREIGASIQGLIRSLPGYNAQHSIKPISQDIYDALIGIERAPEIRFSPLPAPNDDLRRSLYWDEVRTSHLISLFNRSKQILFAGPPGTGKTFVATALANAATDGHSQRSIVQFHPSYAYEDFVEGIRPILTDQSDDDTSSSIRYELRRGILRQFSEKAASDPSNRYVLVIDEINRANAARVFGELLYCLEYRGPSRPVTLPYSNRPFYLPDNLWLLATMNSADRSITQLDAAFRRRFHQWTLEPDYLAMESYFEENNYSPESRSAIARLKRLNDELLPLVGPERLIGQSFFLKPNTTTLNFEEIWAEDLAPVLREHLYNQVEELNGLQSAFLSNPI